jgi:hypothetical protein
MPTARRHFWVIRWVGDQFQKDFLHVLPARWGQSRVKLYMVGLYFNSPSLLISERTSRIKSIPNPVIHPLGLIIVGDNPFLVGCEVQDLTIDHQTAKGVEVISYTEPVGYRLSESTGLPETIGSPHRVSFERSERYPSNL